MNFHITKEFIEKLPKAYIHTKNDVVLYYKTTKSHNIPRLCKNLSTLERFLEGITVNNYSTPTLTTDNNFTNIKLTIYL